MPSQTLRSVHIEILVFGVRVVHAVHRTDHLRNIYDSEKSVFAIFPEFLQSRFGAHLFWRAFETLEREVLIEGSVGARLILCCVVLDKAVLYWIKKECVSSDLDY